MPRSATCGRCRAPPARDAEPFLAAVGPRRLRARPSAAAAEAAPVAEQQGQLFVSLERTFGAFADVRGPYMQETISAPETEDAAIRALPRVRPFLVNTAGLFADLRPGFAALRPPVSGQRTRLRSASRPCAPRRPSTPSSTHRPGPARLQQHPDVREGISDLTAFSAELNPFITFVWPAQSVCNYATLLFRNVSHTSASATASAPTSASSPSTRRLARTARAAPPRRRPTAVARPTTSCTRTPTRTPPLQARARVGEAATRATSPARRRSATSPATRASSPRASRPARQKAKKRRRRRSDGSSQEAEGRRLRRADLPQGPPAPPGPQRPDPDRVRGLRHLPRDHQVPAVHLRVRAEGGLRERGEHPQGLAGADR